jgi:hypothetical protein
MTHLLDPTLVQCKMQTTTGEEQDFWYDLCANAQDINSSALEIMNKGRQTHV